MKKFVTALTIIAAFGSSFAANAAMMSGTVKSVDSSHDAITLSDGSTCTLAEGSEAEDFKPGTKVSVTYTKQNGKNVATSVKLTK